jgi:hypothetical protein
MNYRSIASLTLCMLVAASVPAFAQWGTQATLANAYNGTVTIDSSGNLVSTWYQNSVNAVNGSTTTWRAVTRKGAGQAWNGPATAGTSFDAGGQPDRAAVNSPGRAAVVCHGYSSDFLNILYTNMFQP